MSRDTILNVATDRELGMAVFRNLFALFRAMPNGLGGEVEERNNFSRHISFPTNPMFKGVWETRLSNETADQAIEETIAWFKERNAPYFFWWTGPGYQPG